VSAVVEKIYACRHGHGIKPVIHNRAQWEGAEQPPPGGRFPLHLVHNEAGTVFCYDTVSDPPVSQTMSYVGY
jgi:hypothetical protein